VAARAAVALVAVVLLGWLGVMYSDAREQARGVEAAGRVETEADFRRADAHFRRASRLNPDTAPDLARAWLRYGRARTRPAIAGVEEVLRREPDNLTAWGMLFTMTRDVDRAAASRALAARRRLDPVNARPRRR
jgi:hypothetical protein